MASDTQLEMNWLPIQKRKGGPLGLKNLGNSCYLNSVLQCLTYTPPLANFCLRNHHSSTCTSISSSTSTVCPFCLVEKRIFRSLTIDSTSDAPARIYSCLALFAKHFRQGWQEDAHEFLRYVIEACNSVCVKLHKLLTVTKLRTRQDTQKHSKEEPHTVVKDIFGGVLQSQVKCLSCSTESNKLDDIMDLSLDVFKIASVKEAMCRYFQPEVLDGNSKYKCEKCKKLTTAQKQMSIFQAPNVLVIQLKRFENIHGGKIDRHIGFEERLELHSHMCKGTQDKRPEYLLYALIVHAGSSQDSGHYYSYVKDINGKWFCCNDAHVTSASPKSVLSEKAYILFYVRHISKSTIKGSEGHENNHEVQAQTAPSNSETQSAKENGTSEKRLVSNVSSCSADKGQGVHQVRFNIVKPAVQGPSRRLRSNGESTRGLESPSHCTEVKQSNGIGCHLSPNGNANHCTKVKHCNGNGSHLSPNGIISHSSTLINGHEVKHGDHQAISKVVVKFSNGFHESQPLSSQSHGVRNSCSDVDDELRRVDTNTMLNESDCARPVSGGKRKTPDSSILSSVLIQDEQFSVPGDATSGNLIGEKIDFKLRLTTETRQLLLQSGWCNAVRDSFQDLKKARVNQEINAENKMEILRNDFKTVHDNLRQKVPSEVKEHLVELLQAHFAAQRLKS